MIKLEQYRDTWLAEKMDDVIGFYPREFYPLAHFYNIPMLFNLAFNKNKIKLNEIREWLKEALEKIITI